jgi:lipid-A-disaccharide synthase-like uncharacterized protein
MEVSTMFRKLGDVIFYIMNLGILVFWMYGTAAYAPDSPVTPYIWLLGIGVFGYIVFSIFCRINDRVFIAKNIKGIINRR